MERVYRRDEVWGLWAGGPALEPEDGSISHLLCDQGTEPLCATEDRGQEVSSLRN